MRAVAMFKQLPRSLEAACIGGIADQRMILFDLKLGIICAHETGLRKVCGQQTFSGGLTCRPAAGKNKKARMRKVCKATKSLFAEIPNFSAMALRSAPRGTLWSNTNSKRSG